MNQANGRQRIAVLMGGSSSERDVSLSSGRAVAKALAARGHDVVPYELGDRAELNALGLHLRDAGIDAAFIALHGKLGEDGCVQGLLELIGIPYTGSNVLTSALAMDKLKSKEMFRLHNVPTPPYYLFTEQDDLADLEQLHGSFGFPVVVKPRSEGSSIGVRRVDSLNDLARAIVEARRFGGDVLVERFVKGQEVHVGILDGRVLGAIEVAPKSGIYDFEAKYTPGMTDYFMPARLPTTRYRGVLNLADRAARALDCAGAVRVDLLVTGGENEYVLEVNTVPGMTATSLLPRIAQGAGLGFDDLCEAILHGARTHVMRGPRRRAPATERTLRRENSDVRLLPDVVQKIA